MPDDREPPTPLGKDILTLLALYGQEMERAWVFESLSKSGRQETTLGEFQQLQQSARLLVLQRFSEVREELLSGKEPSSALHSFLEIHG